MTAKKLIISNKIDQLEGLQQFLEQLGAEWQLDPGIVFEMNLVLEEYISNLICYGYSDKDDHEISIGISNEKERLLIVVIDDGTTFNILKVPDNIDIEKPLEDRRIGGLGIHLIKSLTESLDYKSEGGRNTLIINFAKLKDR